MVIFCGFGIVILTTFLGFSISKIYQKRVDFFTDFNKFINFYLLQIQFNKNKMLVILNSFTSSNTTKVLPINEYIDYIKNNEFYDNFSFKKTNLNFLTSIEIINYETFFNKLGKYTLNEEVELVNQLIELNKVDQNEAVRQRKKYGNLYGKVGLIVGCLIVLLVI